ncbi:MAG: DinB family protein [Bacteroidia bacterium]|nr:DinB family protein [Bacteroidia bacterium]
MGWLAEIDIITQSFKDKFGNLSEKELNWKPNPQTWSIAQNIDHLIVVNETYFPVLASLKEGTYNTPFIVKLGFMVSFLGKTVLNAVKSDRKEKMKTFPVWEPTISQVNDDILQRFEKHQNELKRQIETSKELVEKGTIISSPANRNIVYKLETAFDIIVSHEQRHLEQASEILNNLNNLNNTSR